MTHEPSHAGLDVFRRATNLELFLDLAFVFAVTQLATLISHDLTLAGAGRGLLVSWLIWWLWSQFAWAGTTVDVERNRGAQIIVLATIPPALLMGVALPDAFHSTGAPFGAAYLLVQLAALLIQGREMWPHREQRTTFLGYAALAGIGPLLVAVGGATGERARWVVWVVATLAGIGGALLSGRRRAQQDAGAWVIDPGHFSERHALFVIICLGEVLVAAGATAFGRDDPLSTAPGVLACAFVACVLWWTYFAYIPKVAEHALAREPPERRGRVARDMFSFGHFPMVFGIIAFAVVAKHVVKDPAPALPLPDLSLLLVAIAAIVGGFMAIHFLNNRGIASERPLALVLIGALTLGVGPFLPGAALVALVGAALLAMHAITVLRLATRLAEGRARMGEG